MTPRAGSSGPGSCAVAGQRGTRRYRAAMATRAPLPANSLLALAELLSLGPEDGDEDSADAVRSAPGVVAGGGAPWPVCLNRPVSLRRRKAPRTAAPGRGVSVP